MEYFNSFLSMLKVALRMLGGRGSGLRMLGGRGLRMIYDLCLFAFSLALLVSVCWSIANASSILQCSVQLSVRRLATQQHTITL